MKFQFKIQQYQTNAVTSVVSIFEGQPYQNHVRYIRDLGTEDSQAKQTSIQEGQVIEEFAYGFENAKLTLSQDQILKNIQKMQEANNIQRSDKLLGHLGACSLDVEMETGTGKTYVYIKTIFELNKRYGWSKFIVVVPSIAIREGVNKTFEITADHFHEYYKKKARFFIYNSSNLEALDDFSSSSGIQVMIVNTQAFAASMNEEKNVEGRKGDAAARIIFSHRDNFGSRRPIDVIAANRPILILDEPQKMGKENSVTQKALQKFNPLFTLNYSATHKEQHNPVYVLDAVDAFNKRLVKKIEVKGFELRNLHGTNHYMFLENILVAPNKPPRAKLEIEVNHQRIKREAHIVDQGTDLYPEGIFESDGGDYARAYPAKKHIQDYVFTEGIARKCAEYNFAQDLDTADEVCVYAKLPRSYHIPTPVGNYTPDWAIAFKEGAVKHIYFVAETKGSMKDGDLRGIEAAKIACAKQLYNKISTSKVRYYSVDTYQELLNVMDKL